LVALEGSKGYWLVALEDFTFLFNEPDGDLSRIVKQPVQRSIPEVYSYTQSSKQSFYFIERATIGGRSLDTDDIIIAYNGDVVVGARYWNGEYTDVPAMGMDEYIQVDGYCNPGDKITFKVWDSSSNEMLNMSSSSEAVFEDLQVSILNLTEVLPDAFSLNQAYPNPFNPVTTLSFELPIASGVSLQIYNLQGREIATLVDGSMDAGYHSIAWNGDKEASGMYFVKMVAGEYIATQKLMLVK
jgi:hypothetical protein